MNFDSRYDSICGRILDAIRPMPCDEALRFLEQIKEECDFYAERRRLENPTPPAAEAEG